MNKSWKKSRTIIFNIFSSILLVIPQLSDLLPIFNTFDNKNYYNILSIIIVIANIYLRTITTQSIKGNANDKQD